MTVSPSRREFALAAWPEALSRRFTPTALLGRGQFGTVFAATERARGARVAVKALRADRPTALQAFKREFRALTDLAHDNLVALHELGREGDHWFLVMEAVDGLELRPALEGAGVERVRHVFVQVALGLSFLHASGRLHRDLKPSNVRVTPAGRAVVLDFGLAVDGAPDAGEGLVGAAGYLAPEQAAGAHASAASDVYALGVMLHEALCGVRPFEGPALEVLANKRRGEAVLKLDAATPGPLRALCARMLALSPAARPSAAEVVTALDSTLVPLLAWRPDAPLIGREDALSELERAFERVRAEGAVAVWLQGAPGLGKSALLRQFLASKRDVDGVLVLASRCFEHESTPFKAIDGLVDGLARWLTSRSAPLPGPLLRHAANLGRSFPALRHVPALAGATPSSSPPEAHLHESAVALREVLTFAASEARVLVCIDDLHWADTDSVPFLRELLEGESPPPVLFLGALRDEGHPLLEAFRGERVERAAAANAGDPAPRAKAEPPPADEVSPRGPFGARAQRLELRLAPLTPTQSHHLARALLPEGRAVEALVAEAGGNPFLLHTLAGHEGGLRGAVSARVAKLPAAAQRLLEVVCLAGAPLPRALWVAAAALGTDDGLALGHLRAGRLVRVRRDGSLEPYHDTLRRAVEAELPAPLKSERHAGLAHALEAAGAVDPELLALHLHGAGRPEAAAAQATRGAERAMSALAFHHAAQLYARSLEWAPSQPGARAVKAALGEALSNAGQGQGAAEALLAACEGAPPTEQLELRRRAAGQLLRSGHLERGLSLTRSVLEAQGLSLANTPRGAVASLVWTRARLRLRGRHFVARAAETIASAELARIDALTSTSIGLAAVDSLRAADLMGQALLRALRAGESARVAVCLGFETAFSGNAGGRAEARTRQLMAEADEVSAALGQPYARACALGGAGIAFFHLGHLAESRARLEEAVELFTRCPGAVKERFTIQLFALAGLAQAGDFAELGRRLGGYLRLAIERGDRYAEANLRAGLPNLVWLAADDEPRARLEAELARAGLETTGYSVQHFFHLLCRFHIELYVGDGAAAQQVLDEGLPALERSLLSRTEWIAVAIAWMRGRALLLAGASGASRRALLREVDTLEKRRRPWADALALSLRAGERRAAGADPAGPLERAVKRCEEAGLELHAHCGRFVTARLHADAAGEAHARAAAERLGVKSVDRMARLYFPGLIS
ncbi:MAG: protein kinase [Archangium sp.]|nr:protein kinase [Archangium sp.]